MKENNNITLSSELREKLFLKKLNGGLCLCSEEIEKSEDFGEGYKKFLNEAKTEREVVSYILREVVEADFREFDKSKKYKPGDRIYYVNRNKSIILAVIGRNGLKNGARMSIAHIDSPRLDLKPNPVYELNDLAMFKTHYYGGIKKYQWLAIPLSLHGRIIKKDGSYVDINIGEKDDEPCFCITDLLPHLAREQMSKTVSKFITGENLNVLIGSLPFKEGTGSELVKLNILRIINEKYGIIEEDFLSAELELVPAFKAKDVGFDRSMIGGYGHDDRSCAYPSFRAILEARVPENTAIVALADKEETGSDGNTGMASSFLRYFIADLAKSEGLSARSVLPLSKCLSSDVNAAFDPTYSGEYEASNSCYINRGVVITKYTGSGGKGGTSDASAEFMGEIRSILNKANILWQTGEIGKVDGGGGGTIAKFVANLNADVVDVGVPVLSMHAPFEVISKIDLYMVYKAICEFLV